MSPDLRVCVAEKFWGQTPIGAVVSTGRRIIVGWMVSARGVVVRELSEPGRPLSVATRLEIRRLLADGVGVLETARRVRCSRKSVQRVARAEGGLPLRQRSRAVMSLSLEEREEVSRGLGGGESLRRIAARLQRSPSTVSREVAANGGRRRYRAVRAERQAALRARRPKPAKLAVRPALRTVVEARLELRWSPQQIATWLRLEFPHDADMQVSHETIYQSLYVQGRGALRRELTACLRSGRTHRAPQGARPPKTRIAGMVMISERPAEVEDRAVPGHWEGDLVMGKGGKSQIGTLVERSTRFVQLIALPHGRTADVVCDAIAAKIATLPAALRRSLTWDQGNEMAKHAEFTIKTGIEVYFCDPHSPWQRGSNENTNGLLRQYFPKGVDLSTATQHHLDLVADQLNGRPRQTLGWMTPSEAFNQLVATTG
jgi:transposase, IS30 family